MQLTHYIASCGICSRRKAVDLIRAGHIQVNDITVTRMGYQVQPDDKIMYQGKVIVPEHKVYILLNKPAGYVSTVSDENKRKTVIDLVKLSPSARLYPIGRLDAETTGLLLLTNDGFCAQKLAHPRYEVQKVYEVYLNRSLQAEDAQALRQGITLVDGLTHVDKLFYPQVMNKRRVQVTLHSGKNRIVRRMFAHLGYTVMSLERIAYAHLRLTGVRQGQWRHLTSHEINQLIKD